MFKSLSLSTDLPSMKSNLWLALLVHGLFLQQVAAMFSKRGRDEKQEQEDAAKRLKADLADLFLSNEVSAQRAHTTFRNVDQCGVPGFQKLARTGGLKNKARDLTRQLLKGNKWPSMYYARVRTWSPKKQQAVWSLIPMLLPHEILFALGERAKSAQNLFLQDGLSQQAARHLAQVAAELHLDPKEMVPMGVWGDGVPYNFDRSQSLEVFT